MGKNLKFLTEKKFGLPVWAWAIVLSLVLYLGYRYFKGHSSSANTTPADATAPVASDNGTQQPSDSGGGGGGFFPPQSDQPAVGLGQTDQTPPPPTFIFNLPSNPITNAEPSPGDTTNSNGTGSKNKNTTAPQQSPAAIISKLESGVGIPQGTSTPAQLKQAVTAATAKAPNLAVAPITKAPVTAKSTPEPVKVTVNSSSASGAAAVKAGTSKGNAQAKKQL